MAGGFTPVELEIVKKDEGGKELNGAGFKLYKDGYWATDGEATTGDDGKCSIRINGPGTFEIYETTAPDGYNLNSQINYNDSLNASYVGYINVDDSGGYSCTFYGTLNSNNSGKLSISIYNSKNRGGIKLTKKDYDTEKNLQGVWIFITTEDKTIGWENYTDCNRWTQTNNSGEVSFQNLEEGTYYIWELNQLEGYNSSFKKVGYVNVEAGNNSGTLVGDKSLYDITNGNSDYGISGNIIYNRQYGKLQIIKEDEDTRKEIKWYRI